VFVDTLDLAEKGFDGSFPTRSDGPYRLSVLSMLKIYCYLNHI
jgi:hypothetical protein